MIITVMRAARQFAGISQEELGKRVGVSQPRISMWERGLQPIPADRAVQIGEILDVAPEILPKIAWKPRSGRARRTERRVSAREAW